MKTSVAVTGGVCIVVGVIAILAVGPVPPLDGSADATPSETARDRPVSPDSSPNVPNTAITTNGATATSDASTPPIPGFDFSVDRVGRCGETCREVEATLTNAGSTTASNVTVDLRLYPGNGTSGGSVWNATVAVGSLPGSESASVNRTVDLSAADAFRVSQNDGWITVEATVRSDRETTVITKRRSAT